MTNRAPTDAAGYARAEDELAALLGTAHDVLLLQDEAILALEAVARGLGGPGVRALNLVSGPYSRVIGRWLAAGGAEVDQLTVPFDQAIAPAAVGRRLKQERYDVVAVVHAEAATGVVNPVGEIAALAHEAGAVVMVDAVASIGAEPLPIDDWGLELVMIGPQKALAGPTEVSAVVASAAGWQRMDANPAAPRDSILSLLDLKTRWLDSGRTTLPVICQLCVASAGAPTSAALRTRPPTFGRTGRRRECPAGS